MGKYTTLVEVTQEMNNHFEKRTKEHIARVQKYASKIAKYKPALSKVVEQASSHDASKFQEPEVEPYKHISWQYKMKQEGGSYTPPKEISDAMNKASEHHVTSNRHHPEFHQEEKTGLINRADRDKPPEKMIHGTRMNDVDISEMTADWMGMSEELGDDPKNLADKSVNVRWKFNEQQTKLIYELIENVWK